MQNMKKTKYADQAWMPDPTRPMFQTACKTVRVISGANMRYRLTKLGEQMARLPIDPKIAHFAGGEETRLHGGNIGDCVRAVDPRPARAAAGARDAAAKAHERFYRQANDFAPI